MESLKSCKGTYAVCKSFKNVLDWTWHFPKPEQVLLMTDLLADVLNIVIQYSNKRSDAHVRPWYFRKAPNTVRMFL